MIVQNSGESTCETRVKFTRKAFQNVKLIGKGGYSKVWEVRSVADQKLYAVKEMPKLRVLHKRSVDAVLNERRLLASLSHPFLVNLHFAFQDYSHLYLVLDLLEGGDLRFHIGNQGTFSQEQTQFYVACLLTALEYVHSCGIIHGDLKPENLVLDSAGYLRLTDFGVATAEAKLQNIRGTPAYMAPEALAKESYTEVSDYYALGVMVYEFMLSRRPYTGRSPEEVLNILRDNTFEISLEEIPDGWAPEVVDFVNQLLSQDPSARLGANGLSEIKNHPWLKNTDWKSLGKKSVPAPFVPAPANNFNYAYVHADWQVKAKQKCLKEFQPLFLDYYFDNLKKYHNTANEENQ